ncbi:MAG: glycine cleavage system protein H [Rhizobiales bacterium]|nr:glycine cleavage system protein H [Hyphomicrobiales bacterium]
MSELLFSPDHAWVLRDGDHATVGISDHAQDSLGPLVHVDLPSIDTILVSGASCGLVESMKTASDVIAPLAGRVVEINKAVLDDPSLINRAAETDGWLFRLAVTDGIAASRLMARAAYIAGL